jgi:hypothetical protein
METTQPGRRGIDTRTEVLDEPIGTIEFERPAEGRGATGAHDALGEDYKPASSSYLGGGEQSALQKAERRADPNHRRHGRGFWQAILTWFSG